MKVVGIERICVENMDRIDEVRDGNCGVGIESIRLRLLGVLSSDVVLCFLRNDGVEIADAT